MKRIENILALTVCGVFALLGLAFVRTEGSVQHKAEREIHFLNVGQGDAILFEDGDLQTLVDTGPNQTIISELGKVMPATDKTIETVFITHPHADHLGGLGHLLETYSVEKIYYNGISYDSPYFLEFLERVRAENIPIERLVRGRVLNIETLSVRVLWPPQQLASQNLNDTSLVLEANFSNGKVLLTGDASADIVEAAATDIGGTDILKVSHHGSKTGTSIKLIETLQPDYAVIPVGSNSYGHPAKSVLDILSPVKVLRTDINGTISFGVGTDGVFLY